MTPKEKAKELVKRFHPMTYTAVHAQNTTGEYADAIKCAIVAVNEIYKLNLKIGQHLEDFSDKENYYSYWEEVKDELELEKL